MNGSSRVKDREATAYGGEWGSRFCRVQKLKMLRARALFSLGKIGGTARP
jgi:hypothetical protein